jgi:Rrf2 family cysteine metabolism transcriptional repressor
MKLSTRGRYGVRIMLDLALHYGEGPILLRDISKRQGISEKYLWQLINPLKTIGLISSTRGSHGGYVLAKPPGEISLKEIVRVLEGSLCLVDCIENPAVCERSQSCTSRDIWSEASHQISQILESMTLDKMVAKQRAKNREAVAYSI